MQQVRAFEISDVSLRNAALIKRAWAPTVVSPISPSSSALVTSAATESSTITSSALERTSVALLRLSDDRKCKGRFAGRFRAENFDYSSARKSTDSEGAVDQNVSSRNHIDINDPFAAQTHDRTFAIIFRDLLDRQVEVLISRGSQFISGCFFFGLCRHIRKNLTTTHASIRQAQKRWPSIDSNEKGLEHTC